MRPALASATRQADLQPHAVRVRGLHVGDPAHGIDHVAGLLLRKGQAIALGIVEWLLGLHLLVFADCLRGRIGAQHAQALARPAEIARLAARARATGG